MSAVRFVFALLLSLVAVLVFISAPTLFLWQLKLAATEYGHWMVLAALAVVLAGRRRSVLDSVSVILAILAGLAFLSSSLRAMLYASTAASKMNVAFPVVPSAAKSEPFSLFRLWTGGKPAPVEVQTFDYATHDDAALQLDFYGAQNRSTPAPCVVVLPGGGWEHGDRLEFATMNHYLAQKGYSVAAISYRLAPKSTWPAQQEDLIAALGYLRAHAGELNLDPERFVLFGRSAGGQIVEAIAAPAKQPGIVGCIAFYAPADMQFAYKYAKRTDILNSEKLLKQYLGGTPTDMADSYDDASGYLHVNPKTPPTLLLHGADDELVWVQQSQRYSDRLRSNEVRQVFLRLPWATHAFDYNFNGPGGQLAAWAVERFLASVTGA